MEASDVSCASEVRRLVQELETLRAENLRLEASSAAKDVVMQRMAAQHAQEMETLRAEKIRLEAANVAKVVEMQQMAEEFQEETDRLRTTIHALEQREKFATPNESIDLPLHIRPVTCGLVGYLHSQDAVSSFVVCKAWSDALNVHEFWVHLLSKFKVGRSTNVVPGFAEGDDPWAEIFRGLNLNRTMVTDMMFRTRKWWSVCVEFGESGQHSVPMDVSSGWSGFNNGVLTRLAGAIPVRRVQEMRKQMLQRGFVDMRLQQGERCTLSGAVQGNRLSYDIRSYSYDSSILFRSPPLFVSIKAIVPYLNQLRRDRRLPEIRLEDGWHVR